MPTAKAPPLRSITCRPRPLLFALALLCLLPIPARLFAAESDPYWPQFRGPNASGVAPDAKPPVEIGPSTGVLWKIEVPWSPSSPTVWKDHILLTTYVDRQLETRCYDQERGKLLWKAGVTPDELEAFHSSDGSPAASTPAVTEGQVVSYFGSFGLVCYDDHGKELWRHRLPVANTMGGYGSGSSPIIVGRKVFLNRDIRNGSSLLALDLSTGGVLWETPRPTAFGGFGTPIFWNNQGVDEIVVPGSLQLKGYDLNTGQERWLVDRVGAFVCTTPVTGGSWLYFGSWSPGGQDNPWPQWEDYKAKNDKNHDGVVELAEFDEPVRDYVRGLDLDDDGNISEADWKGLQEGRRKGENVLIAVKPGGKGDISASHVAWRFNKGLPYVPSPLYYAGRIYLVRDGGLISSLDANSGRPYYTQERLPAQGSYYASPVAADDRLYVASLTGKLSVIKAGGDAPELLHQADFGERIFATPALVGDRLYLRTEHHLYAFGTETAP